MTMFRSRKALVLSLSAVMILCVAAAYAVSVGQVLSNVKIFNTKKADSYIPGLGSKVVTIFYNDVDVKDINDPLSNAIKAKNYPKAKYAGIGIANTKDTWKPDAIITSLAASKQKQFPDSFILLDYKHICKNAWGLGVTNDSSWVIVVGKDRKVKFAQRVTSLGQSSGLIGKVIPIIEAELKK